MEIRGIINVTPDELTHISLMRHTLSLAREARASGNHPFAAVLVHGANIVAEMLDESGREVDPTNHPEIAIVRAYCRKSGLFHLAGHTIYTNVEPCPMCAGAIYYSGVSRLVYSLPRDTFNLIRNRARGARIRNYQGCRALINDGDNRTEIVGGVIPDEGEKIFHGYRFKHRSTLHSEASDGL